MGNLRQQFIEFALASNALAFGEFTTKAGRRSPYFFNAGRFDTGALLGTLGRFYAKTLIAAERERGLAFDMLFGPAYKGITLASATAVALAGLAGEGGRDVAFAYNRKEAKAHGEGGTMVGAPLAGRVVIVDDVLTDGAAKRESVEMIRAAGAEPVAVLIALDRMEKKNAEDHVSTGSAVQAFESEYGIPVIAIATLDDIMDWLKNDRSGMFGTHAGAVLAYRERYGAVARRA